MKQITAYQSKDGQIFETMEEALQHDALYDFDDWYETNRLFCGSGRALSFLDVRGWLTDNADFLRKYLDTIKTS